MMFSYGKSTYDIIMKRQNKTHSDHLTLDVLQSHSQTNFMMSGIKEKMFFGSNFTEMAEFVTMLWTLIREEICSNLCQITGYYD
jgi:hypothetical protein